MDSIDKAIECVFQSLVQIEEAKDKMLEITGLENTDTSGVPSSPSVTKIDSRIDRLMGINTRLQDTHVHMTCVVSELEKI